MQYYDFSLDMFARKEDIPIDKNDTSAYIRAVHLATNAPNVDVYINDKLIIPDLRYREFTEYLKLPPGTYNVKIYNTNDTKSPLLDLDVFVAPKSVTTLAAYSENHELKLYPVEEIPISNPTKGKVKMRVAHFIENLPPIDVVLANGTILYKNLNFKDVRNYIELPPGTYTLELKLANTDLTLLYVPNATLGANKYYTLYLIGLINGFQEPQMLIPLDGITYLDVK